MKKQLISDFLEKYGVDDISAWSDKEFEKVSDELFQETEIRISINTLKRLFGKIKTPNGYKPQNASLNALSKYLGFASYHAYQKQASLTSIEQTEKAPSKDKHLPIYVYGMMGVILIAIFAILYLNSEIHFYKTALQNLKNGQEIILKVNPSSSAIPTEATFVYEVPEPLYHSDGQFVLDGKSYPLQKGRQIISKEFIKPEIYTGRVVIDDSIYTSQAFSILSDGWIFLNGSEQFNDSNRGANKNVKVESKIIKDFYIPDYNFILDLQYDSIRLYDNLANNLKIKLKLVFDHAEAFFIFFGDDIVSKSPFNNIGGKFYPEIGDNHLISKNLPLNIRIVGDKKNFIIYINEKEVSSFKKEKLMGDLKMIKYETRRVKVTLNKFSIKENTGTLQYDLLAL